MTMAKTTTTTAMAIAKTIAMTMAKTTTTAMTMAKTTTATTMAKTTAMTMAKTTTATTTTITTTKATTTAMHYSFIIKILLSNTIAVLYLPFNQLHHKMFNTKIEIATKRFLCL